MLIRRVTHYLLYLLVFTLPFQTRYIYQYGYLNGGGWEYGTFSIFGTQILLWLIIILFTIDKFRRKEFWQPIFSRTHFKKHWFRLIFIILFLGFNFLNVGLSIDANISYQHWLWVLEAMCLGIIVVRVTSDGGRDFVIPPIKGGRGVLTNDLHTLASTKATPFSTKYGIGFFRGDKINKLLAVFWLSGVIQGLLAIYQFSTQHVFACKWLGMASQNPLDGGVSVIAFGDERYLRAYGSFSWPNSLGAFLAVCLLVGLILILGNGEWGMGNGRLLKQTSSNDCVVKYKKKFSLFPLSSFLFPPFSFLITVGQLIIITGLILSFSRGAWLSALVGIAVLLFIIIRKSITYSLSLRGIKQSCSQSVIARNKAISYGLYSTNCERDCFVPRNDRLHVLFTQLFYYLILILILIITLAPLFNARFDLNNHVEMVSYTEHTQQYVQAEKIIGDYNLWNKKLWFGLGQGTYTLNLYNNDQSLEGWQYQPAHNIYILWLAELGIIGFIVFLSLYLFILRRVWKYNRLFIPVILVMLVHGLFDHWWWTLSVGVMIWWVVVGLSLSILFSRKNC